MNETISVLNTALDQSDMKSAIIGFSKQVSISFSIIKNLKSTQSITCTTCPNENIY